MRNLIFAILLSIDIGIGFVSAGGNVESWYDFNSCSRYSDGCPNPCAREGKNCCYCDETKNYDMVTCSCCPKDYFCCPANPYTKYTGGSCCPQGSICQEDGTCLLRQNALYAHGACGQKCRPDTTLYITVDDYCYVYLDGVKVHLNNPKNWTRIDAVRIKAGTRVIAVWGENGLWEAGILASSSDGYILSNYRWKCTHDVGRYRYDWMKVDFNDDDWEYAYESHQNKYGAGRRDVVKGISSEAWWIWSNRVDGEGKQRDHGWNRFAYCRLTLNRW